MTQAVNQELLTACEAMLTAWRVCLGDRTPAKPLAVLLAEEAVRRARKAQDQTQAKEPNHA